MRDGHLTFSLRGTAANDNNRFNPVPDHVKSPGNQPVPSPPLPPHLQSPSRRFFRIHGPVDGDRGRGRSGRSDAKRILRSRTRSNSSKNRSRSLLLPPPSSPPTTRRINQVDSGASAGTRSAGFPRLTPESAGRRYWCIYRLVARMFLPYSSSFSPPPPLR